MLPLSRRWAGNRKWCISTKDLLSHTVWLSSHRGASWRYTPPILRFYSASLYLRLNPNPWLALGGIGGGLKVGAFPQSHLPIMFATQLNGTPKYPKCLGEDHFLDKMLNYGSYCAIFPEHLYISLFGWGKKWCKSKESTQRFSLLSILSRSTPQLLSVGGTVWSVS